MKNDLVKPFKVVTNLKLAIDWWGKLPMYNMDKRLLAARHYKTEPSFLSDEQIEFIYQQEN